MYMIKQQAADPQSGSFLLTMQLCLLLVGHGGRVGGGPEA